MAHISPKLRAKLRELADRYETEDFLADDPSLMMHLVSGQENQEDTAFLTSCISYGQRSQFMPRARKFISWSGGEVHQWLLDGAYRDDIPSDSGCFYRLYTNADMLRLIDRYRALLREHGTLGNFISSHACDGLSAVSAVCQWFTSLPAPHIVPKNTSSACKRVCMFLRWMVRSGSPVDLGLWHDIIDRATLIMPLDTHVVRQSMELGLLTSASTSMSAARKLTSLMAEVFTGDPTRADFALFGLGINKDKQD